MVYLGTWSWYRNIICCKIIAIGCLGHFVLKHLRRNYQCVFKMKNIINFELSSNIMDGSKIIFGLGVVASVILAAFALVMAMR